MSIIPIRSKAMTPVGAVVAGLAAAAVGTLAMDLTLFARYKRDGGKSGFRDWELSAEVESWDQAPAPAQVGKRLVEGLFGLLLGAGLWSSSYVILPAAKLYRPIWEYDLKTLSNDLGVHLVYGLTTAATFKALSVLMRRSA